MSSRFKNSCVAGGTEASPAGHRTVNRQAKGAWLAIANDRRSMRMVWKTMRLRHVGMAFFWACSMLTFRSSILLAGEANTPEWETIVVILSFVANMTTMLALAAWVENDPERIDRLPSWPLPALTVAGLVLVFASGRVGGVAMLPLLLGGAVLAGVGYGYFWGSWADCYGRMHPARTSFYLPVAFLLTAVPVSYTHLDVYKRQLRRRSIDRRPK